MDDRVAAPRQAAPPADVAAWLRRWRASRILALVGALMTAQSIMAMLVIGYVIEAPRPLELLLLGPVASVGALTELLLGSGAGGLLAAALEILFVLLLPASLACGPFLLVLAAGVRWGTPSRAKRWERKGAVTLAALLVLAAAGVLAQALEALRDGGASPDQMLLAAAVVAGALAPGLALRALRRHRDADAPQAESPEGQTL